MREEGSSERDGLVGVTRWEGFSEEALTA